MEEDELSRNEFKVCDFGIRLTMLLSWAGFPNELPAIEFGAEYIGIASPQPLSANNCSQLEFGGSPDNRSLNTESTSSEKGV